MATAAEELAEVERAATKERARFLEEAESAGEVALSQKQTIEELRVLEASSRDEVEKIRRGG